MGLIDKTKQEKQNLIQDKSSNEGVEHQNQLTKDELELLLVLIKQSTFKGEFVEIVYNTTLKLQNQYIKQ